MFSLEWEIEPATHTQHHVIFIVTTETNHHILPEGGVQGSVNKRTNVRKHTRLPDFRGHYIDLHSFPGHLLWLLADSQSFALNLKHVFILKYNDLHDEDLLFVPRLYKQL